MRQNFAGPCLRVFTAAATACGLAGCGATVTEQQSSVMPLTATQRLPGAIRERRKVGDLLYVATGDNVYALSYPGGKLMLSLGVRGYGLCTDAKGDVFVTKGYDGGVDEYDHDGRLIETIKNTDFAFSCAVDPTTGNLAVPYDSSGENYVVVYSHASTRGNAYGDNVPIWGLCTYDRAGNLFVDGSATRYTGVLAELKKGSTSFVNYTPGKPIDQLDSLQSYRRFLAVPNPSTAAIYEVEIVQGIIKIRATSYIKGWYSAFSDRLGVQTWLADNTFIGQYGSGAELGLWRYPKGGAPTKVLGPFLTGYVNIYGVVISQK